MRKGDVIMSDDKQLTLFPGLTKESSLQAALGAFEQHMEEEGFALNSRKAFTSDIRLLGKYLGVGQPIGDIGTKNLNDFLIWLLHERGVPCSPKSYARRVTSLKLFFGWLREAGILFNDPATAVIQSSVSSPLPTLPFPDEIEAALAVTQQWRKGDDQRKPDARPHLLLTLLLQTGVKKGEAMAIVSNHIDRDDPNQPQLQIRYKNPNLRYKERNLDLDPDWLSLLDEYLAQYQPKDTLFTCTARNLEYILADIAETAGLEKGLLSFENLRWVSAMRDYQGGVEPTAIRQKLGLSPITWRETRAKLERLIQGQQEHDIVAPAPD
jgi:site-specific recombinase XerD